MLWRNEKNGFAICRGRIYRKVSDSQFTIALYSSVKEFLLKSLQDPEVADVLTPHIGSVTALLTEPACVFLTSSVLLPHFRQNLFTS